MPHKTYVIGVGADGAPGLPEAARRLIGKASLILGGRRLLALAAPTGSRTFVIDRNLEEAASAIKSHSGPGPVVVLATGDPNFFGIGRYLTGKLGGDAVEIIPHVSSMQLAFALIKESWDDATFASVHGRPAEDIVETVRRNRKVCLLTDEVNTPSEMARVLREHRIDNCRAYVCQDLGSDAEDVVSTDLYSLAGMSFSPLSVLLLIKDAAPSASRRRLLGIPETDLQSQPGSGLITKLEIRAISLARLRLAEDSIVWDIGAGTGAVSIEASMLAWRGRVFAVEKDAGRIAAIRKNVHRFAADNVTVVEALAPQTLDSLPDPDAVFIGGSGGHLDAIIDAACRRLKPSGRIVVNAVTLETLRAAAAGLKRHGFASDTTLVSVARSEGILDATRFQALNPVFIITGWRPGEEEDRSAA